MALDSLGFLVILQLSPNSYVIYKEESNKLQIGISALFCV